MQAGKSKAFIVSNNQSSERVDFVAVKEASLRSLDFIVPRLLPGGKREGDEWVVRNPTRNDNKPGSFKVNMRTGVWADFAYAADKGGDIIDLVVYLTRKSNLDAAHELADMLGMTGGNTLGSSSGTASSSKTSDKARRVETVSPADSRIPPKEFPPRTLADKEGKPFFVVAGDEGPKPLNNELRRHFYCRGGVPVRIKIMKKSGKNRGSSIAQACALLLQKWRTGPSGSGWNRVNQVNQ
jgi:putative DNA primase/helicase